MGGEGRQEGRRWEGSHEWRQSGEGLEGTKVERKQKDRKSETETEEVDRVYVVRVCVRERKREGEREKRGPVEFRGTVCHLAISWPTTRSQHEAFYEWAEAIIEALD